ncbi:MAG: pyridoxamine 5'-phosphate oxidase [Melioribacteraceae bacterium]|nr:pyridoxamine 5'-phosphate oxidase [Melioribacteraceae bacterium]
MKYKLSELRINYDFEGLDESKIEKDPFLLFEYWFKESVDKKVFEPNGMTLATVDADGKPSARIVLLKDISKGGFVFYTHYTSRKGKQLQNNNNAAAVFWWNILARQVRIEGFVEKLSAEESDSYFNSRPRGSRLGAVASNQSKTIPDYPYLIEKFNEAAEKYNDEDIPRPENWGGYRLIPESIEFWQGRENRLHDRILFTKQANSQWKIERLAP